jgi:hypothetical protein
MKALRSNNFSTAEAFGESFFPPLSIDLSFFIGVSPAESIDELQQDSIPFHHVSTYERKAQAGQEAGCFGKNLDCGGGASYRRE